MTGTNSSGWSSATDGTVRNHLRSVYLFSKKYTSGSWRGKMQYHRKRPLLRSGSIPLHLLAVCFVSRYCCAFSPICLMTSRKPMNTSDAHAHVDCMQLGQLEEYMGSQWDSLCVFIGSLAILSSLTLGDDFTPWMSHPKVYGTVELHHQVSSPKCHQAVLTGAPPIHPATQVCMIRRSGVGLLAWSPQMSL